MPALTRLVYDVHGVGDTGEMLVCAARDEARVHCLPTRLEPAAFEVPRRLNGQPLPIALAVEGRSGTILAADFRRQNVLAAYSPLEGFGLGMVLKVDTAEIYRPIRRQLEKSLLLLALLVALGVWLLRWRLLPLVSRLVESEAVARAANHELRESEARYRAVAESANDAILSIDADGRVLSWNPAAERLFGYAGHEILGQSVARLMPERYRAAHAAGLERMRAGGESRVLGRTVEMHGLRQDGGEFPLELSLASWSDGETRYYTGIARDITERKRAEETIRELSLTDELTGLRNRRGFVTLAEIELALARRMQRALRLFYLDLDRMKEINDRFGHAEGDRALRDLAEILRRSFRETDVLARLGGDEFVVLAIEDHLQDPEQISARIQQNVAKHNRNAGRPYPLSVSIGAVRYNPHEHADIERLLAAGDAQMYRAKQRLVAAR
jgi:diguanylate cyclase (GGDEF)-like protein/PAS domain S-box-containing protein